MLSQNIFEHLYSPDISSKNKRKRRSRERKVISSRFLRNQLSEDDEYIQLQIPKRHRLLPNIGSGENHNRETMYGSSHIRDILVEDIFNGVESPQYHPPELLETLDEMIIEIGRLNRELFVNAIDAGAILQSNFTFPDSDEKNPINILLSPHISKNTFIRILPQYKIVHELIKRNAKERATKRLIANEVIKLLRIAIHYHSPADRDPEIKTQKDIERYYDYVVNNSFLWYIDNILDFNNRKIVEQSNFWGSPIKHTVYPYSKMKVDGMADFIKDTIKNIRSLYSTPIDLTDMFKDQDNNIILPEGFVLQKGTSHKMPIESDKYSFHSNYSYFTIEFNTAISYILPWKNNSEKSSNFCKNDVGEIYVFQTTRPLKLMDFSDVTLLSEFRKKLVESNAPKNIISSFDYGWKLDEQKLVRKSMLDYDIIVVEWLCSRGYDGYIATGLSSLADEILICNPNDNIKYIERYTSSDFNIPVCEEPYLSENILMLLN